MLRKKVMSFVLLCVLYCVSSGWAVEPEMRTIRTRDPKTDEIVTRQVPVTPKQADPHENTSVLVEAFMVRVSTEALAELGVNPIAQAPAGVSVLKILACLDDPEKAEIISGAKVTAKNNNEAESKNTETFYVKRETVNVAAGNQGPVESKSVSFDAYSSGKRFRIVPRFQVGEKIRLEASYSETGIIENEDKTIPPTQLKYDWSGVLTLESGIPVIAGSSQNNDTLTFLILTATIQGSNTET